MFNLNDFVVYWRINKKDFKEIKSLVLNRNWNTNDIEIKHLPIPGYSNNLRLQIRTNAIHNVRPLEELRVELNKTYICYIDG